MITNFAKKSAVSRETFSDYFAHSYSVVFLQVGFGKKPCYCLKNIL